MRGKCRKKKDGKRERVQDGNNPWKERNTMKCNLSSKRILGGMLVVGAILAVCGAAAGMLFDEAQHMQARAAGMVCGMGTVHAGRGFEGNRTAPLWRADVRNLRRSHPTQGHVETQAAAADRGLFPGGKKSHSGPLRRNGSLSHRSF